ncbi:MAG: ferredoxin family protein [Pirellulaceae bacterium]|nr:ferredoxin family protein [Pirellulaceae bacterium]
MMPNIPFHVVMSLGQSRNPEKRDLEAAIVAYASQLPGVDVISIPHLYDLAADGESVATLKNFTGPIVVFSWLFPRAAHWVLDRSDVRGQYGEVLLSSEDDDDQDDDRDDKESEDEKDNRVTDAAPRPSRKVYCIDLRSDSKADIFYEELRRIHQLEIEEAKQSASQVSTENVSQPVVRAIEEHPTRRWYPVIDYSRCTNCMECIDFCLFGVYGVDGAETILVEQPDNCRKGCPACSRVCPANAIMFPQHKTPAIAGADIDTGGFKIDLSKLFGAPERNEDSEAAAARERDEQLILAGRNAVGSGVRKADTENAPWVSNHRTEKSIEESAALSAVKVKDDFDRLLDQLDQLDL